MLRDKPLSVRLVVYLLLMLAAHALGWVLKLPEAELTIFWPPVGVALAILLSEPKRLWALHLIWMYVLDAGIGLWLLERPEYAGWVLYFAGVNLGELLLALFVLGRMGLIPIDCGRVPDYAGFAVCVLAIVPTLGGLASAGALSHLGLKSFGTAWQQWWFGNALGFHIAAPATLGLLGSAPGWLRDPARRREFGLFALAFLGSSTLACSTIAPSLSRVIDVEHLAIPFLVWAALRFEWRPVAALLLVTGALMVLEARLGTSALVTEGMSTPEQVHSLQAYLAATGVPALLLGAFVFGLKREMEGRRRAEQHRLELERHLHHAQKLQLVGQLAGGVAHDMNNLLTVMRAHVDLLAKGEHPSRESESIDALKSAVDGATEFTRSLLLIARKDEPDLLPIELGELIQDAARMLERSLPKRIEIEMELPQERHFVLSTRAQLRQVLMNLVLNSRDAIRDRGRIGIRLKALARTRPRVELVVEDDGAGMEPRVRERLFEPFYTTKAPGSGTGLGMAIVETVVQATGGRIHVDSKPGRGTRIALELPTCEGPVEASSPPAPSSPEPVVLADDDPHVRTILATFLEGAGHGVTSLASGEELLELYGREPFEGAVVLDRNLAGLDGIACLEALRERGFRGAAVLVSGDLSGIAREAQELGAHLLQKPFSGADLRATVREALDEARSQRSALT